MKPKITQEINLYDGLKLLRKLSKENFPCTFSYVSCNTTAGTSKGLIIVEEGILTAGLPRKKSKHWKNLIAYENLQTKERKHFWLPLLMTVNNLKISHDRISR